MAAFTLAPLQYGKVVGRFTATVGDGIDLDVYPDGMPMSGTVTFTPSAKKFLVPTAQPDPATDYAFLVTATLDSNGYLTFNGQQGVWLLASTDPALNPTGFTWHVTYALTFAGATVDSSQFDITVPISNASDPTTFTDLTRVAPVAASNGVLTTKGDPGAPGPANTLSIGTVTTGTAAASITGTAPSQTLNLVLPSGGGSGTVKTVSGKGPDGAGNVALVPGDVGLGNVNNTSDANKPVSTAQQTALNLKADDASVVHQSDTIVYSRRYSSGVWPVRGTIPAGSSVQWTGPSAPPVDGTYALAGVDTYLVTVS